MFLMMPWFVGHLLCLFMYGTFIGDSEQSLLNFAGFLVLLYLGRNWRRNRFHGDIVFLYGIIYPVIRFFIEFQRPDAWTVGGIPVAQYVSVGFIVVFLCLMVIRRKLRRPSMVYVPGTPWTPSRGEAEDSEALLGNDEAEQGGSVEDVAEGE